MDSLRSPARSTFGRPRPSGPRRPATFKSSPNTPLGFSLPNSPDEAAPSYSGRDSPEYSSHGGSSPVTSNFNGPTAGSLESSVQPPRTTQDQAVQVSSVELTPPSLNSRPSTPSISRSTTPAVKIITKPPTLTHPPSLSFESASPIAWRGMTLETAQWTLSSGELQEVVSRAIRRTAQESYIRLLSVKTVDEELQAELERLETVKATTQAQYRFNMHRRTNLLQSILAVAGGDGDVAALGILVTQLADITAACDKYMLQLLNVADHKAQIQHVQDVHVSSALAMALRKLNTSYAKRTTEVRQSRERIEQLKGELEEAWKVAEDMAQEMDDLNNFHSGFSSEEDADDDQRVDDSVRLAEVVGITGTGVAMKARLTKLQTDATKAREDAESSKQKFVSAARKRSSRASKASLRIPRTPRRTIAPDHASVMSKASAGSGKAHSTNGVVAHVPSPRTDNSAVQKVPKIDSFLEMAPTRPVTPTTPNGPPPLPTAPPPLPDLGTDADDSSIYLVPPSDTPSVYSKHSSIGFEIPPINIHPAEDEAGSSGKGPTRRVQSMQPSPISRVPPMELPEGGSGLKRATPEHKTFDVWPWSSLKSIRRRSMPMPGTITEEDAAGSLPVEGRRSLTSPRSPSFSPSPEPRASIS
ncbi:hypothetical protein BDY19DRAFT_991257 [Irpex rosettiformis]|uniref:Uncharacterized protein n=1 Tax=Irpex rosettiformis TaxID=378272 RepID=A0ACB8UBC5_9APHY|nr:hypothetical protein BDY19DRAFT_991257 [Irpex rosettiformis]